jgi:hypothetical protein
MQLLHQNERGGRTRSGKPPVNTLPSKCPVWGENLLPLSTLKIETSRHTRGVSEQNTQNRIRFIPIGRQTPPDLPLALPYTGNNTIVTHQKQQSLSRLPSPHSLAFGFTSKQLLSPTFATLQTSPSLCFGPSEDPPTTSEEMRQEKQPRKGFAPCVFFRSNFVSRFPKSPTASRNTHHEIIVTLRAESMEPCPN